MVVGTIDINDYKKCREITGNFDHHVDAAVQCGAHHPMEHILGFTRSHWMPPSSECLRHIALAAVMVDYFGVKQKKTTKNLLLAS